MVINNIWQSAASPHIKEARKAAKLFCFCESNRKNTSCYSPPLIILPFNPVIRFPLRRFFERSTASVVKSSCMRLSSLEVSLDHSQSCLMLNLCHEPDATQVCLLYDWDVGSKLPYLNRPFARPCHVTLPIIKR